MAYTRWDPFRNLLCIQTERNKLFDENEQVFLGVPGRGSSWTPSVDIHETEESFVLSVDLPGVKKEDVTLEVKDSILSIGGERRQEKEVTEKSAHRIERRYGKFSRVFNIPSNVDASRVKAAYKDGVLQVTLPKVEDAKPRQIEIAA